MSDLVPDSISTADLQSLAENAPTEQKLVGPYGGLTEQELLDYVDTHLNQMSAEVPTAMLPKVICVQLIQSLLGWHSRRGMNITTNSSEEDDCIQAMMWHRDAGKLQAILQLLETIDCGEGHKDFLCE